MRFASLGRAAGAAATIIVAAACGDLDVTNPNNPDVERALSTPSDVRSVLGSSVSSWFTWTQDVTPGLALAVGANSLTGSFGNYGMRFSSSEPRIAYANNASAADIDVARDPWNGYYSVLGAVNDGLGAVKAGVLAGDDQDESDAMENLGRLIQGAILFNLAAIYDSAFVVDEDTVAARVTAQLQPYTVVRDAALAKFDAVIAASTGQDWPIPEEYTRGMELDGDELARVANTMAARTLAYTPRTPAENAAVNWAKVRAYAEKGISGTGTTFDTSGFFFQGDGGTNWYDLVKAYGNYHPWLRVDVRIIHEMAPAQPAAFVGCDPVADVTSPDKRFGTDILYRSTIPHSAARGCYHFSNWYHFRYPLASWSSASPHTGRLPYILRAENDLLLAEALIRTGGSLTEAARLINNTRVTRGQLAPATASSADVLLKQLMYERDVELMNTGAGVAFFDLRRWRTSQGVQVDGTTADVATRANDISNFFPTGMWRHLPVPATELEILFKPIYTFGGSAATER